jgi:hypothetical protein
VECCSCVVENTDTTQKARTGVVGFVVRIAIVCLLTEKLTYEVRKVGYVEFVRQRGDIRRVVWFLNVKSQLHSRPKLALTWAAPKRNITLYDLGRVVESGTRLSPTVCLVVDTIGSVDSLTFTRYFLREAVSDDSIGSD